MSNRLCLLPVTFIYSAGDRELCVKLKLQNFLRATIHAVEKNLKVDFIDRFLDFEHASKISEGGKFATGINDTGGKFCHQFPLCC